MLVAQDEFGNVSNVSRKQNRKIHRQRKYRYLYFLVIQEIVLVRRDDLS